MPEYELAALSYSPCNSLARAFFIGMQCAAKSALRVSPQSTAVSSTLVRVSHWDGLSIYALVVRADSGHAVRVQSFLPDETADFDADTLCTENSPGHTNSLLDCVTAD